MESAQRCLFTSPRAPGGPDLETRRAIPGGPGGPAQEAPTSHPRRSNPWPTGWPTWAPPTWGWWRISLVAHEVRGTSARISTKQIATSATSDSARGARGKSPRGKGGPRGIFVSLQLHGSARGGRWHLVACLTSVCAAHGRWRSAACSGHPSPLSAEGLRDDD